MTLSTEIAGLTGDEDSATLRAINDKVAILLGWREVPNPENIAGLMGRWLDPCDKMTDHFGCPKYTTSLDATLAEIRRRGWVTSHDTDRCRRWVRFDILYTEGVRFFYAIRTDDNLALAALEALVRAVEGRDA